MKPAILDLLPIVAYQKWQIDSYGRIRNEIGACPVCNLK